MAKFSKTVILLFVTAGLFSITLAQTCNTYAFRNNNRYAACNALPVLDSFLHWTYHPSNRTVDLAYRHTRTTASNWVAWSLNPTGPGMIGAQCLVAFQKSTGGVRAYTSPISDYGTTLQEEALSFRVPSLSAEFIGNNEMIIYATIELPQGNTSFNQVWQSGGVSGGVPSVHPLAADNRNSSATIDFAMAQVTDTGASMQRRRNVHGVLNIVSWGVLMPLGVVVARYMKAFKSTNPAWFCLHVSCQVSAYVVGIAVWATGLKLEQTTTHRNIGITRFVLVTLQAFSTPLKPKKSKHKRRRFYWNIYHYTLGYTVIILNIVNIFEGFDILDPAKKWKKIYIGILIFIGACAAVLEAFTCMLCCA